MELLDDRYELTGLLGRGGMAEVHRAHDRVLQRAVAVKVLLDLVPGDNDIARHRFWAEARLLSELDHPAVVTLLDVGTAAGRPYLVMELVEGGTLSHRLGEAMDPVVAASIGAPVAEALAHAHAHGVVHRDVKPGNVLLGTDGRVRLADFGIARILGESAGLTGTGTTVGTVAYLAPEQVRGDRVTPAADVYALGLMLLEVVTGVRAYPGTSTEAALARLHRSPTIPVSLPRGWPRLLAAMTATDPRERPSAAEAATALRGLAAGDASAIPAGVAEPERTAAPRTESFTTAARTRTVPRYRLAAAAAAAVAASVVGGVFLTPDPAVSDEKPPAPPVEPGVLLQPTSSGRGVAPDGDEARGQREMVTPTNSQDAEQARGTDARGTKSSGAPGRRPGPGSKPGPGSTPEPAGKAAGQKAPGAPGKAKGADRGNGGGPGRATGRR